MFINLACLKTCSLPIMHSYKKCYFRQPKPDQLRSCTIGDAYALYKPTVAQKPEEPFILQFLTLAAKRRRRVTASVWRFLSVSPSVCPSILCWVVRVVWKNALKVYARRQGRVVTSSPSCPCQWCSSVHSCSLYLHGTYVSYVTDCHTALLVSPQCSDSVNRQWRLSAYVTEAFSL